MRSQIFSQESFCYTLPCSEEEFLNLTSHFSEDEGTILLHSAAERGATRRCSYLAVQPKDKIVISANGSEEPWKALDFWVGDRLKDLPCLGYLSYEMGHHIDPTWKIPTCRSPLPLAIFYRYESIFVFDPVSESLAVWAQSSAPNSLIDVIKREKWRRFACESVESSNWQFSHGSDTREGYLEKVRVLQEGILSGDVYQANLSQLFAYKGDEAHFSLYRRLIRLNPAPYAAYLRLPSHSVISLSPELFVKRSGETIKTSPIKGTAPRSDDVSEDLSNKSKLLSSQKERAELLMITDLMRNDFAAISEVGSIRVLHECVCESFRDVYHLISHVQGVLRPDLSPVQILKSLFPAGSITGCPKIRAMQWIAQLEKRARGIYTGSIGVIRDRENFEFNVAIRTLQLTGGYLELQLGGGVVTDSDPLSEYEETLHKGRSFFDCLKRR